MTIRRTLAAWLLFTGSLHLIVICAGFLAPYDPAEQDREHPYSPPMVIHFVDAVGHFHLRPFTYLLKPSANAFDSFEANTTQPVPIHFLVAGARYKLLGILPLRRHLFGGGRGRIYLFGTDGYGRDILSRILYGGQISLFAGLLATALALFFGTSIGCCAGYFGGWTDDILMRGAELCLALPWLYLLLGLRAFLPLSVSPIGAFFLIVAVVGTLGWARPARMIRGVVLSAKERDFVRAARGFGASPVYLLWRHVLPETWSVILTQAAVLAPLYVLAEVTLSFLGLGVPEPTPSWGNLLSSLQHYSVLVSYWWMYFPAVAMVPFFIGYLGLASSLQEWADPAKIEA
ncbi:MAG TPA: ABC transporter permease [Terriglobales bacterium]|nr:ABC transporter permease [Terriglobales bacterium]